MACRRTCTCEADAPGTFHGQSAHFSGDGFSDMHFEVVALAPAEFADWLRRTRSAGGTLDDDTYRELSQQGVAAVAAFGDVAPGLYERIVAQALPPGPGPDTRRNGAAAERNAWVPGLAQTCSAN